MSLNSYHWTEGPLSAICQPLGKAFWAESFGWHSFWPAIRLIISVRPIKSRKPRLWAPSALSD